MRQTVTHNFLGLHKNKNCAFPLESRERAYVFLKNGTKDFQNSPLFERSAWFYATTTGNFEGI